MFKEPFKLRIIKLDVTLLKPYWKDHNFPQSESGDLPI